MTTSVRERPTVIKAPDEALDEGLCFGRSGRPLPKRNPAKGLFQLIANLPGMRWYAERGAPRHLRLERVDVPLPGLPAGPAGLRIGFLSDNHHALRRPLALPARRAARPNPAAPALIML